MYVNKKIGHFVVLIVIFLSFALPLNFAHNVSHVSVEEDVWEEFRPDHIDVLVGYGKVVLVDVTADWCLTCKFNKFNVLDRDILKQELINRDVVAMQADWTNPNDTISDYLRSNNRSGIPFNVVYGPAAPDGIILSELLSYDEVVRALDAAVGKK